MIDDTELAERVTKALKAKAAEVTTIRRGFDPDRGNRLSPEEPQLVPEHRNGHRRGRMLAVAATVVVLATAGGVVLATRGGDSKPTEAETGPAGPGTVPAVDGISEGLLAPSWVPEGLRPWDVSWNRSQSLPRFRGKGQLFSTSENGDARVLVNIDAGLKGVDGGGEPVTVRGQQGSASSWGKAGAVSWEEGNVGVLVSYKGMSQEDALAFLDSLDWRSGNHQDGFEPPEGAALSLVSETGDASHAVETLKGSFVYGDDDRKEGEWGPLLITTSIPSGSAAGTVTTDYLHGWFDGRRDEDGTVTSLDLIEGSAMLKVLGPDGSEVVIVANYDGVDRDDVQRIAEGISPISDDELGDLRSSVSDLYETMPVVASSKFPSATVSVRGRDGFRALCIEAAREVACVPPGEVTGGSNDLTSSLSVEGMWYVAAASPEAPPLIAESLRVDHLAPDDRPAVTKVLDEGNPWIDWLVSFQRGGMLDNTVLPVDELPPLPAPEDHELDSETAVDGEWNFALVAPPADVGNATAWFENVFRGHSRSSAL